MKAAGLTKKREHESIKLTIVRILLLAGILFGVLLGSILFSVKKIIMNISGEYTSMTSEKMESELEMLYEKMNVYAINISHEDCVIQLMTDVDAHRVTHLKEVKEIFAYYQSLEPAITDIALVNERIHYSGIYNSEELDEMYRKNQGSTFTWLETRFSSFPSWQDKAQLIYSLPIIENGECIGSILLSLSTASLETGGNGIYMLTDETGVIFSFGADQEEAQRLFEAWKALEFQSGQKDSYMIQSVYSEKMRCYQVSGLDSRSVSGYMGGIKRLIYLCMALIVLFLVFIVYSILKRVVEPLSRFQVHIEGLTENNRYEKANEDWKGENQCAEIYKISEAFDSLMAEQKKLNKRIFTTASDLYEAKIQKQQAELSYMRSQIDPHFLYNTLEAIRRMALVKSAPEIAEMALDMGKIFRYSTKGEELVPLAEELEMVQSYLHIQQKRFENRIQVFTFIPEETLSCIVVKMVLQPLIENAIIHGLEEKEKEGSLFLAAKLDGDDLLLTVKDDGVGIPEEKLAELQKSLEQEVYDTSKHVGILNTQARIRLRYGRRYGITIESTPGDGTTMTVRIPAEGGKRV